MDQTPPPYQPPYQPPNQFPPNQLPPDVSNKKLIAGLCGILLGGLGVHKFILGYTTEGIIALVASIFTCGIFSLVGLIEGIIYLVKSDQEFYQTYMLNKKPWF